MPMNTANKLTLARVFMIPLFLVIAYWGFPGSRYVALGVYILACLTDLLDQDLSAYEYFQTLSPEVQSALRREDSGIGSLEELQAQAGHLRETGMMG